MTIKRTIHKAPADYLHLGDVHGEWVRQADPYRRIERRNKTHGRILSSLLRAALKLGVGQPYALKDSELEAALSVTALDSHCRVEAERLKARFQKLGDIRAKRQDEMRLAIREAQWRYAAGVAQCVQDGMPAFFWTGAGDPIRAPTAWAFHDLSKDSPFVGLAINMALGRPPDDPGGLYIRESDAAKILGDTQKKANLKAKARKRGTREQWPELKAWTLIELKDAIAAEEELGGRARATEVCIARVIGKIQSKRGDIPEARAALVLAEVQNERPGESVRKTWHSLAEDELETQSAATAIRIITRPTKGKIA